MNEALAIGSTLCDRRRTTDTGMKAKYILRHELTSIVSLRDKRADFYEITIDTVRDYKFRRIKCEAVDLLPESEQREMSENASDANVSFRTNRFRTS